MNLFVTYLAEKIPLGLIEGKEGPLTTVNNNICGVSNFFTDIVSKTVGVLSVVGILWFVVQFMIGAFQWISAGGDPKQLESARSRIIQSVLGLVIILSVLILTSFIGSIFGFEILNVGKMINDISGNIECATGQVGGTGRFGK